MNISLIAFTEKGANTAYRLKKILEEEKHVCELYGKPQREGLQEVSESLSVWCVEQFQNKDAIIFVSAVGIAVRGISDAVKDKLKDPAVIVIDETEKFVIPILSGHVGGANALAKDIARKMQAIPVITTATDLNGAFAIDVFAKKNQLNLDETKRNIYKDISARILAGEKIGIYVKTSISCEGNVSCEGKLSAGLERLTESAWNNCLREKPVYSYVIAVTDEILPDYEWIVPLVPACHVLGIGCKKDTPTEKLRAAFYEFLNRHQLSERSISALASIDLKQWEIAILSLAQKLEIPFHVYSAEFLSELEGDFTASAFVKQTTGVDNVCERAAVAGMLENQPRGSVQIKKESYDGITFSLAGIEQTTDWRIHFE